MAVKARLKALEKQRAAKVPKPLLNVIVVRELVGDGPIKRHRNGKSKRNVVNVRQWLAGVELLAGGECKLPDGRIVPWVDLEAAYPPAGCGALQAV